jgi:CxxC motif-containing protein
MVQNQVDILTSQLWAIKNTSSAAEKLLSGGNINVAKITNYNEFATKIMDSIHNEFNFDLNQSITKIYINAEASKIGEIIISNTGVQNDITAAFTNVSEAVAALSVHESADAAAGATPLGWLVWVLLAAVVVLGILALSYTLYKKFAKKGTATAKLKSASKKAKKAKGGIASWFKKKKV